MRCRFFYLVLIIAAVFFCCSGGKEGKESSLDAGPSPRPLFFSFEGLKWGMIPEEVVEVWGPPIEEPGFDIGYHDMRYSDRAGFKNVTLYFSTCHPSLDVYQDVKPKEGSDRPLLFLSSVSLDPGLDDIKPKEAARADLVSHYGEPLTDRKLYESRNLSENTEIFRLAECTLAVAHWAPAEPSLNWPERLDSLSYVLAPQSLIREIPRTRWNDLRGAVPISPSSDIKARYENLARSSGTVEVKDLIKLFGPPNLYWEEAPGKGAIYYFWLTESFLKFKIGEGKVQSYEITYAHEPQ